MVEAKIFSICVTISWHSKKVAFAFVGLHNNRERALFFKIWIKNRWNKMEFSKENRGLKSYSDEDKILKKK